MGPGVKAADTNIGCSRRGDHTPLAALSPFQRGKAASKENSSLRCILFAASKKSLPVEMPFPRTHTNTHKHTHTHAHTHTHTHTRTHIRTHTHTHTPRQKMLCACDWADDRQALVAFKKKKNHTQKRTLSMDRSHFKVFTHEYSPFSRLLCVGSSASRRSVKKTMAEVFSDA